jgi:hypothetical protein
VGGFFVGVHEAAVPADPMIEERESAFGLGARSRVELSEFALGGVEAAFEQELGLGGDLLDIEDGAGAAAEELLGVQLLVDLQAADEPEGMVVPVCLFFGLRCVLLGGLRRGLRAGLS